MSEKISKPTQETVLAEAFHSLAAIGETILLPLSLAEDTLKRNPAKNPDGITSFLHRFEFGDFFISIVYTPAPSDLTSAPSTLEARICLDRSENLLFFMPYDIIPYINPQDMICRYFPYIESPDRLTSCYRDLCESLVPYLADFQRIATDNALLARAYADLKGEMARCYHENIDSPSGKGEEYDNALMALRFTHFVKWKSAIYSSAEYSRYLEGDAMAISAIAFRGSRPDYIKHIALTAVGNPNPDYLPVREESASLVAMVKATKKAKTLGVLLLTLLLSLPLTLLTLGVCHFGTAYLVSMNSIYYTGLSLDSFFSGLFWIITMAFMLAYTLYPITLRLFFKDRYRAFLPFYTMTKRDKRHTSRARTKKILIIAAVIFTVFSACRGVHFTSDAILVQSATVPQAPQRLDYDDILTVEQKDRSNGSFYYVITFEDEKTLSLESVMTKRSCEDVAKRLALVFNRRGIEIVKEDDTPTLDGNYDTTNRA